uniref:Retrotransposon protein, putative, unclassified n=2 Tax=Oryza sativa subsp. japonica TaxID=39947 RepID=Q8LMQ3_ORYSJ|nr:Putative plant disease resistance polyprotein [Oryza sativa Japonica Group]ABF94062.1 retrotransposon protein, putative, unclassified [Oryza sativa Japonica Group]
MESKLLEKLEGITKWMHEIDQRLDSQGGSLEKVTTKVDLAMDSVGKVQQECAELARSMKRVASCSDQAGILGSPSGISQESVLASRATKALKGKFVKLPQYKSDVSSDTTPGRVDKGDLWKAKQLKDYRRAQGLCFKCGDKYTPEHRCAVGGQIKAMQLEEVLTDDILDVVIAAEQSDDEEDCHISLNALTGAYLLTAIRLRALVHSKVLLLLVDSGSSHNFIDYNFAQMLGLPLKPIPSTLVKVANGDCLPCQYVVPGFFWWIQGHTFTYDMRVVTLGGHDAILGMDWLEQWGEMSCHWANKTLKFQYQGSWISLQGVQDAAVPSEIAAVTLPQLLKWHKGCEIWAAALLEHSQDDVQHVIPSSVQQLLTDFDDVFHDPKCLPPHRVFDHAISLVPDATPVNYRPYRYSPLQKDEIEKQVKEMIDAGLITPSMSPYASPVLLVKKKDGSWRFCVDYRRLNALTIKSKFPMPVVDELLDELSGTKFFSKLDLKAGYHQIRMVETDEAKTTFKTHHGQFQFRVMPFGLTNAPSTFQCLMNSVFAPFIRKFVLVFMDDILVYSPDLDSHLHHLQQVFAILRQHQLFAKRSKCSFACTQLEYLGHIISDKGVSTVSRPELVPTGTSP